MSKEDDWMGLTISHATGSVEDAYPGPAVAVILVRGDREVARASNQETLGTHAEHIALRKLAEQGIPPNECVLYTNLEPCSARTGQVSCTDLLVQSGIKEVHISMQDPYLRVHGRGISLLKDAGLNVITGECLTEAMWTNRRYLERFCPHCGWVLKD